MSNLDIRIVEVENQAQVHAFVRFPFTLYKDNPYWAPPVDIDEKKTLSKANPSLQFCDLHCILVYKGDALVGRVALIINHRYNEESNAQMGRFGWIDFVDDYEVSKAIFDYAVMWHKSKGMTELHGPLGFTDFDYEGMLCEGFDQLGTMSTIYNYAYYNDHVLKYGFTKKAEWVERLLTRKEGTTWTTDRPYKLAALVEKRYGVRLAPIKTKKQLLAYGPQVFELINLAYKNLYGFTSLTQEQMQYYIKSYFPFAIPSYIPIVIDEQGKVVGFLITFPSFTKTLQKIKGKLFPLGFLHMLYNLKVHDRVDFYLVGVHPDYLNKGLIVLMLKGLIEAYNKTGVRFIESGITLEDNIETSNFYAKESSVYNFEITKRRRSYFLSL